MYQTITSVLAKLGYQIFIYILLPWVLVRLWLRGQSETAYAFCWKERFGFFVGDHVVHQPVWIHAVSLGETRAVSSLINALLAQGFSILLSHSTATGRTEGERLFGQAIKAGRLQQAWLPYDYPRVVKRWLKYFKPHLALLVETEVWPNLIAHCQRMFIPVVLINARLSAKTFRKINRLKFLSHPIYQKLDLILAQSESDKLRFEQLGCQRVEICGNLKFDLIADDNQVKAGRDWREQLAQPVITLASSRAGEEKLLLEALQQLNPSHTLLPLILIVPRHPNRFEEVAQLLAESGFNFTKRSGALADVKGVVGSNASSWSILLGDSIGEMPFYYAASDVVLMGGTFVNQGGQNFIEACALGVPVLLGPSTFNFSQASSDALSIGAAVSAEHMLAGLRLAIKLLNTPHLAKQMSVAGLSFAQQHQGASQRMLQKIEKFLPPLPEGAKSIEGAMS